MNLHQFCVKNAAFREELIPLDTHVSLKVIRFTPAKNIGKPTIVFIAGWISQITAWKKVLKELTKRYPVLYLETREKNSAHITGKAKYDVESIGRDIASCVKKFNLKNDSYILFGSSLGATAILDGYRFLENKPGLLILINPNAVFRVPFSWKIIVSLFYPGFYLVLKPVIKWYLRTFRMDVENDRKQYDKYCNALDSANPWKLKKAVMSIWNYKIWPLLDFVNRPVLVVGASKDKLHEPENIKKIIARLKHATYVDMETNTSTHSKKIVAVMEKFMATT